MKLKTFFVSIFSGVIAFVGASVVSADEVSVDHTESNENHSDISHHNNTCENEYTDSVEIMQNQSTEDANQYQHTGCGSVI